MFSSSATCIRIPIIVPRLCGFISITFEFALTGDNFVCQTSLQVIIIGNKPKLLLIMRYCFLHKVFKLSFLMLSMVERKSESKEEIKDKKEGAGDVIEIPIGKFFGNLRKNPWMVSTVVLAVVVIILLFFKGGFGGGAGGGVTVSEKIAADNLLSFVNSQGQGGASLVSSVREGQLYKV